MKIEIHFYYVVCSSTFRLQSTTLQALILLSDTFFSFLLSLLWIFVFFWCRWYPSFILIYCYLETELFNFFSFSIFCFFFSSSHIERANPLADDFCWISKYRHRPPFSGTKWNEREKKNSIKLSIRYQSIYQNGFHQPIGLFPCTTFCNVSSFDENLTPFILLFRLHELILTVCAWMAYDSSLHNLHSFLLTHTHCMGIHRFTRQCF